MKDLFKLASRCLIFSLLLIDISCTSSPDNSGTSSGSSRSKPVWVNNVNSVDNRSQFVAAVGHASDREMAEKNAFTNLAVFFGQSIKADQTIVNTYYEAVKNGVTSGWIDNIAMRNTISTSVSMDTLLGADIREVWHDEKNKIFYAVAVMERAKTVQLYTEMILANLEMINNLTAMNQAERNTLETVSRYQFAATVADINITYANLLRLLNASVPGGVKRGDEYRLEAQNITRTIPIGIIVNNDREARIQNAFAKVFADLGFRSGGQNARYILRVNVTVSQANYLNNPNKFAMMELSASLADSVTRETLLPYSFSNREGHTTAEAAENRVFISAERKITEEYKEVLSSYLSQLLLER